MRSEDIYVNGEDNVYLQRHSRCCVKALPRHGLALLLVCKQLYTEAALLPFQANNFTFGRPRDVRSLVERLTPIQQRSIADVTLYDSNAGAVWDMPSTWPPEYSQMPPRMSNAEGIFPGLARLFLYLEVVPADLMINGSYGELKKLYEAEAWET